MGTRRCPKLVGGRTLLPPRSKLRRGVAAVLRPSGTCLNPGFLSVSMPQTHMVTVIITLPPPAGGVSARAITGSRQAQNRVTGASVKGSSKVPGVGSSNSRPCPSLVSSGERSTASSGARVRSAVTTSSGRTSGVP